MPAEQRSTRRADLALTAVLACLIYAAPAFAAHNEQEHPSSVVPDSSSAPSNEQTLGYPVPKPKERELKPFSVIDSISMTSVLQFYDHFGTASPVLESPSRSHVLVHTRKGNLEKNTNVETLLLFSRADVQNYLTGPESTPPPIASLLFTQSGLDDGGNITQIRWVSEHEIAFLARGQNGHRQIVALDVLSKNATQLTEHATDVRLFSMVGDHIVFYANVAPGEERFVRYGAGKSIIELALGSYDSDVPLEQPAEVFQDSRSKRQPTRVPLPAIRLKGSETISISPSGHLAIVLLPVAHVPSSWSRYEISENQLNRSSQYYLVDLQANLAKPLLDAPVAAATFNNTPQDVFWSKDRNSVIVTNTFLPLNARLRSENKLCEAFPAVAEIDLRSDEIGVVALEPNAAAHACGDKRRPDAIVSILANATGRFVITRRGSAGDYFEEVSRSANGTWRSKKTAARTHSGATSLTFLMHQSLNERPTLHVLSDMGSRKVLFDPNPQLNDVRVAHTELRQWKDQDGTQWKAGLMRPVNYVSGQSYPLVVQTHGFNEDEFLVDGANGVTSSFAAQALASAGFLVLQIAEPYLPMNPQDGRALAHGYRDGILGLISEGIADSKAVGIIGWSITGYQELFLLSEYPELIGAAAFSDTTNPGYASHLFELDRPADSQLQVAQLSGGAPRRGDLDSWFNGNPVHALTKSKTPVRVEAMGIASACYMWETYVVLREAGVPTDFVYFPLGSHELKKPIERMASQSGTVDWFRFWLKDEEDADPSKVLQYSRWNRMRADWPARTAQ